MPAICEHDQITVLLVSSNAGDIYQVKKHIGKTMGLSCHVRHCPDVDHAVGLFAIGEPKIDVVLLDLGLVGTALPREVFRRIGKIVGDVPVIVFTEREDHELALLVVGEGAADNITRGQFSTDPNKLRDAIEFALARTKISRRSHDQNALALGRLGRRNACALEESLEQGESNLKDAVDGAVSVQKKSQESYKKILKEKDDVIFWLGGGYSVQSTQLKN